MPDAFLIFLNAAEDWAQRRRAGPLTIWRSDVPYQCHEINYDPITDWRVTVPMRDSAGGFKATMIPIRQRGNEPDDKFAERVGKEMDRACQDARRSRIEAFAKANPCLGKSSGTRVPSRGSELAPACGS